MTVICVLLSYNGSVLVILLENPCGGFFFTGRVSKILLENLFVDYVCTTYDLLQRSRIYPHSHCALQMNVLLFYYSF